MITQTFKSTRPPKPVYYPPVQQQTILTTSKTPFEDTPSYVAMATTRAAKLGISTEEWLRRDKIVRAEAQKCNLRVGDSFYPFSKEGYELYGHCHIQSMALSYQHMDGPEEEWRETPYLITARSAKANGTFFCTIGYMVKQPSYDIKAL